MESCNTESSLDLPLESLSLQSFLQSLHKEQWQEVRLGEVAEIVNGYAFKSKEFLNIQQGDSLPIIKIKNVANGDVNLNDVVFYPYSKQLERFLIKYGDILVSLTGNHPQAQSQVVGQISKYKYKQFALLNQRVAKIVTKDVEQDFLYYLLKTNKIHNILASHSSGSANQANISSKDIENLTIPLPPLAIQQKIAEILSSFDDKIDLLHRQNKTLESLALALFRYYFIDNPKRSEWELGKLGEEFDFVMGVSPKGSSYNEQQRGVPMFQGNADFGFRFPTNRIYTDEPKKFAEKFDTLVSVRAPVGAVNMAQEKCCIGRGLSAFRHKDKDLHSYTFYKMKYLSKEFERFNDKGTIFGAISKGDFENIDIWIPPLEYGVRINQELKTIDDKIHNNTKQIQNLQAMRDMLLKAIFA